MWGYFDQSARLIESRCVVCCMMAIEWREFIHSGMRDILGGRYPNGKSPGGRRLSEICQNGTCPICFSTRHQYSKCCLRMVHAVWRLNVFLFYFHREWISSLHNALTLHPFISANRFPKMLMVKTQFMNTCPWNFRFRLGHYHWLHSVETGIKDKIL